VETETSHRATEEGMIPIEIWITGPEERLAGFVFLRMTGGMREADLAKTIQGIGIPDPAASWLNQRGVMTVEELTAKGLLEISQLPGFEPDYMVPILAALLNEHLTLEGSSESDMLIALEQLIGFPITPGRLLYHLHQGHIRFMPVTMQIRKSDAPPSGNPPGTIVQ